MNSPKDDKLLADGVQIGTFLDEDAESVIPKTKLISKSTKKTGSPEFSIDSLILRKRKDTNDVEERKTKSREEPSKEAQDDQYFSGSQKDIVDVKCATKTPKEDEPDDKTESIEDWCDNCPSRKSMSPVPHREDTNMTCSSPSVNASIPNNYLNIDSFSTNILDVHRIFAAQMIMMEKHRRLLQTPTDRVNLSPVELNSTKEAQVPHDESRKDDFHENNCHLSRDNKVMLRHQIDTSSYNRTFRPEFKDNEAADRRFLLEHAKCYLETKELWEKFHRLGTEMIITKTGRRMFPTVRCSFGGLNNFIGTQCLFAILLDIIPCDNRRYRYAYHRSSWLVAGKADPTPPHRYFIHQDGPFTVDQLNGSNHLVSFDKVKLTNNELDSTGQIILNSMHKFQPRIHLILLSSSQRHFKMKGNYDKAEDLLEKCAAYKTFTFPETIFTAVTAYQNQLITKLKIDSNPFAKGFRDSSRLSEIERRSIQSAFDSGGSGHSLKMPSNLIGKYGQPPKELSNIDNDILSLKSNCSPSSPSSGKHLSTSLSYNHDEFVADNGSLNKEHNEDGNGQEEIRITKEFPENEEPKMSSRFLRDQMEDAMTKARFMAAQQFFLQHFQKRRQILLSAAQLQDTVSSEDEKKKHLSSFPFPHFPFNLPPTPLLHSAFPNISQGPNLNTEALQNEIEQTPKEIETDGLHKKEIYPTGQAENALLLFSQIQNYRRHLLESGISKFPIGSLDSNSIRHCDNLIAPF